MQAMRNAPFVALLVVPVAAGAAARRWRSMSAGADSELRVPLPLAAALPLLVAAIAGPAVASVAGTFSLWSPSEETYPAAAVAYVRDHDAGLRVLNSYSDGGYEIAQWYPETRVFIDGRSEFFGDAFLRDYLTMVKCADGWQALLASYAPRRHSATARHGAHRQPARRCGMACGVRRRSGSCAGAPLTGTGEEWWAMQGSNLRPSRCKRDALAN